MDHYFQDDTLFGPEMWFHFSRVYHDAVARAPADEISRFVEIGCWKGRSTSYLGVEIINSGKPIHLYAVDPFTGSAEHAEQGLDVTHLAETFLRNLKPVMDAMGDRFHLYRMTSVQAAGRMRRPKFDMVFLDGSHEVQDVAADLEAWTPKVKPGGIIAGDDWRFPGVRIAVERQFGRGRVQVPMNAIWPYWIYWIPKEATP
jgi:predicted O-methyltransferase YrrM